MSDYSMPVIKPRGGEDPEKCVDDLKSALKDTAKSLKGKIKGIKVVDDSIQFSIEPASAVEKIIDAIKGSLSIEVKPASSPLNAFAEKYGVGSKKV